MSRWTISFKDASTGLGITGLDVDLYSAAGVKIADFVEKGNGSYYVDISQTANYRVKCNGNYVDIYENTHKTTTDVLVNSHVDDETLEYVDIGGGVYKLRIKDGGVGASKLGDDVAGDGLVQNPSGSLSPDVDNSTLEIDAETKKIKVVDDVFVTEADVAELLGDPTFTYQNKVTNNAAVNANIDAIDKILGDMDFSTDPLLKSLISFRTASPQYFNFTNIIKSLSNQVNNLKIAFTQGLTAFSRRTVFNDNTVAAEASGSEAAAFPIYLQSNTTAKIKRRGLFDKLSNDSYLYVSCLLYHIPPGSSPTDEACLLIEILYDGIVMMSHGLNSAVTEDADRASKMQRIYIDISALDNGKKYEVRLSLSLLDGAADTSAAMSEPNVEVTKSCD